MAGALPFGDGPDRYCIYLQQACDAITRRVSQEQTSENSWFIVDHEDLL
jgi:hypothetical protein